MIKYFYESFDDFLTENVAWASRTKKSNLMDIIFNMKPGYLIDGSDTKVESISETEAKSIIEKGIYKLLDEVISEDNHVLDYINNKVGDVTGKAVILRTGSLMIKNAEGEHYRIRDLVMNGSTGNELIFVTVEGRLKTIKMVKTSPFLLTDEEIIKKFDKYFYPMEKEQTVEKEPVLANMLIPQTQEIAVSTPQKKIEGIVFQIEDENRLGKNYIIGSQEKKRPRISRPAGPQKVNPDDIKPKEI